MTPMKHIREAVLKVTQSEMARITGASQGTVSRWDSGSLEPDRAQLTAIRDAALASGVEWNDAWLFEVPASATATATEAA